MKILIVMPDHKSAKLIEGGLEVDVVSATQHQLFGRSADFVIVDETVSKNERIMTTGIAPIAMKNKGTIFIKKVM